MADSRLPMDEADGPPADADRAVATVWNAALLLRSTHWAGTDNYCVACGQLQPCEDNQAADEAIQAARERHAATKRGDGRPPGTSGAHG